MSEASPFIYSEKRVAESLGISRTEARSYRTKLDEGDDWKKVGAEILLSNKGLDRLTHLYGVQVTPALAQTLCEKNGAPKKMRVSQIPPNPRMVLGQDAESDRHLVEVGSNATFVVGDEIEVGPHPAQKGIWRLLSAVPRDRRRLPR